VPGGAVATTIGAVTGGVLYLVAIALLPALLALALPERAVRWLLAVGVVFALGEWVLAYRRSVDRDDGREGLELVLFSGVFALLFAALWILGIAVALGVRRARGRGRERH
jgi:hypothetical protein